MDALIEKAAKTYADNFPNKLWFGKCIFISWYCEKASCTFCYRSHGTHKSAEDARRSDASVLAEAFIAKHLGWRIEFLTGGCESLPFEDILALSKEVSNIYERKIWLNLGIFDKAQLEKLKPYVEGICASIECCTPSLHDIVCPDKPIKPYEDMLKSLDLKRSCCIIIGLGEKRDEAQYLFDFIEKSKLDRITFYALKPVPGSPFTQSPSSEEYAWWIASTRIRFPKLEIIAGLTPKKVDYALWALKAGANALTKFPAIRKFGSDEAAKVEGYIKASGRAFDSSLTRLPDKDWSKELEKIDASADLRMNVHMYLKKMSQLSRNSEL